MEKQKFEESFKDAFRGAENAPSDYVWTNVEMDLENSTGGKIKRRLLFFQLLAAASMVFAMGIGGFYYLNTTDTSYPSAQTELVNPLQNEKEVTTDQSGILAENKNEENDTHAVKNNSQKSDQPILATKNKELLLTQPGLPVSEESTSEDKINLGKRALPKLVTLEEPTFKIVSHEPDAGMVLLAKLKDEEKKYQQKQPEIKEKLWTSVGMGAGTFNPNTTSSSESLNALGNAASSSNPSSGASYSVGVSVASKIS